MDGTPPRELTSKIDRAFAAIAVAWADRGYMKYSKSLSFAVQVYVHCRQLEPETARTAKEKFCASARRNGIRDHDIYEQLNRMIEWVDFFWDTQK